MKRHSLGRKGTLTITCFLAVTLAASVALAQGPGGPPPPFGGPPPSPPPPISAANISLPFLDSQLNLTTDQDAKIKQIQADARIQRDALRPRPGQGLQNGPPSRAEMEANRAKVEVIDNAAAAKAKAVLSASQQKALPDLLTQVDALRSDGIPLQIYGDLKLTANEKDKLTTVGQAAAKADKAAIDKALKSGDFRSLRQTMQESRESTRAKMDAILTDAQRQMLDDFRQSHPRGGPGGPGTGGPPPGF